jgi:hypothetical protein
MVKLFIDDERFPPGDGEGWIVVRTMEEGQAYIAQHGCPTFISFDHDLGYDGLALLPTGYDFAKWLVDQDMDAKGHFFPDGFWYYVHSQNPVGARNIDELMSSYLLVHREMPEGITIGWTAEPTTAGFSIRYR